MPPVDDEIGRLAVTLNAMLERLERAGAAEREAVAKERRFIADASHELRTPLTILKSEIDVALQEQRSAEELRAALASSGEEADRLVRLAEDLLVLARADEGRLPIAPEDVDVRELLDGIAARRAARRRADDRRRCAARTDRARRPAAAPPGRRRTCSTTRSATATGGSSCAARTRDGEVRIGVRDHGPGFPPGFAARAFERFSRPDGGRGGGTRAGPCDRRGDRARARRLGGGRRGRTGRAGGIALPSSSTHRRLITIGSDTRSDAMTRRLLLIAGAVAALVARRAVALGSGDADCGRRRRHTGDRLRRRPGARGRARDHARRDGQRSRARLGERRDLGGRGHAHGRDDRGRSARRALRPRRGRGQDSEAELMGAGRCARLPPLARLALGCGRPPRRFAIRRDRQPVHAAAAPRCVLRGSAAARASAPWGPCWRHQALRRRRPAGRRAVIRDRRLRGRPARRAALDYFAQADDGTVYYLGEDVDNIRRGRSSTTAAPGCSAATPTCRAWRCPPTRSSATSPLRGRAGHHDGVQPRRGDRAAREVGRQLYTA